MASSVDSIANHAAPDVVRIVPTGGPDDVDHVRFRMRDETQAFLFLEFMRAILESRACRERGLFDRDYVGRLLAAPEMHHTRIMGSKLWHLAALELWLQMNLDQPRGRCPGIA